MKRLVIFFNYLYRILHNTSIWKLNNFFNNNFNMKHYEIMKKIRNGLELKNDDFGFIKTLSKDNLIEIIEINNTIIGNLNELIYEEKENKIKN